MNLDADEILPDSDSDDGKTRRQKKKIKFTGIRKDDSDDEQQSDSEKSELTSDLSENEADENDDDDTEALMAELNRIKQERAAEAARLEAERNAREEKIRLENILKGNPLLNSASNSANKSQAISAGDFKVKRRWDDDVVFKNCAKGESSARKKDFINDTLRSDFHKKFMERYIK